MTRARTFAVPVLLGLMIGAFALGFCSQKGSEPASLAAIESGERPATPGRSPAEIRREGNHLVGEPSPYLAQHAHNPVDWYPWGEEALERARRDNKPIFLSIGYSTCHWCHVMEAESFEDDEVAAYLNAHFVSIKVDREQRPDIDALYLDAVAALGGSTGWPLTAFLTPALEPFYGGTYFPRHGSMGRPGFLDVLREVQGSFRATGDAVARRGRDVLESIDRRARSLADAPDHISADGIARAMRRLEPARDRRLGGFGGRQKFPNAPLLLAELRYVTRTGDPTTRTHLVTTLETAMRGGIRDHLAGTFHRYAVDVRWHVPHFEKMLYDNAQLAQVYIEAGAALSRPDFVAIGRAILDDLILRWQQPDGGFVVGFDADDPGGEGFYYSWTPDELTAALGAEDAARFAEAFEVTADGERALEGRSVLHRRDPAAVRVRLAMEPAALDAFVDRVRPRLLAARARRAAPAMDDKELASWNGLAIIALSNAGRWLDEPRYVQAARRAAAFILEVCWDAERRTMLRGRRQGESLGEGFLDDYALPLLGLVRLSAADPDPRWLLLAREIARVMTERFWDEALGAFLQTARADVPDGLPLRRPDLDDGVMPAGGTAAALAMLELGALAGDRVVYGIGERAARVASPRAEQDPFRSGFLLVALDHLVGGSREVVVAGGGDDPRTRALWAEVRSTSPARVLPVRVDAGGAGVALAEAFPALSGKIALDGAPTAYVCEIGRCQLPTHEPSELARQLRTLR